MRVATKFSEETLESHIRQTTFAGIISESPVMWRLFGTIEKVARTNATVLILGESGTGKELIAKAIHKLSARTGKMVPVNCGAIPEEILESELFGHERGAFTGAVQNKIGRFQLADGGTIFLDEIGEMSPKLQVKLLRVLQERVVEPVGSTRSVEVNVRVIAATHKDLKEEVKAGRFREDLFYRLQVVPVELPPLRARGDDSVLLAQYFLDRMTSVMGRKRIVLTDGARRAIQSYPFPGNIRELENLMERVAVLSDTDSVDTTDLPDYIHGQEGETQIIEVPESIPEDGLDFNSLIDAYETKLISLALSQTGGNKKAAASLLRLNRTTLVEKIKKKGLEGAEAA